MDGAVLHAEGDHAFTRAVLHQQVQGEVLHKVTGVITQGLERHGGQGGKTLAKEKNTFISTTLRVLLSFSLL